MKVRLNQPNIILINPQRSVKTAVISTYWMFWKVGIIVISFKRYADNRNDK